MKSSYEFTIFRAKFVKFGAEVAFLGTKMHFSPNILQLEIIKIEENNLLFSWYLINLLNHYNITFSELLVL